MNIIGKSSTVDELVKQIEKLICNGDYQVGQKLPTEMELATGFGVGRSSVREAIRYLQAAGFVEMKAGRGAFLLSVNPAVSTEKSAAKWLSENKVSLEDFFEVRNLIEPYAVVTTIEQMTDAELQTLKEILIHFVLAAKTRDYTALTRYELEFHGSIVQYSRNSLLIKFYSELTALFSAYANHTSMNEKNLADSVKEHTEIFSAIRDRNSRAGDNSMRAHLAASLRNMQQMINDN